MPDSIIFRGAIIRNYSVGTNKEGDALYVNIHMSADFSDVLRDAMKWEPRPQGWTGGDLKGELVGVKMQLRPSSRQMAHQAIEMPIKRAHGFVLVVTGGEDKEEERVDFTVTTTARKAYKVVGDYLEVMGRGAGQLKIEYSEVDNAEGKKNVDQLKLAEAKT